MQEYILWRLCSRRRCCKGPQGVPASAEEKEGIVMDIPLHQDRYPPAVGHMQARTDTAEAAYQGTVHAAKWWTLLLWVLFV